MERIGLVFAFCHRVSQPSWVDGICIRKILLLVAILHLVLVMALWMITVSDHLGHREMVDSVDSTGIIVMVLAIENEEAALGRTMVQQIHREGHLVWMIRDSGIMTSRSSGFGRSCSSKSTRGESIGVKDDFAPKSVTPIKFSFGDFVPCAPSPSPPEETASRKKPRLSWDDGLAKYEKKKVGGADVDVIKIESKALYDNLEPTHLFTLNLVDKSPKITGLSGCSSPATPLSFACSSSPGLEEKTYENTTDGDSNNFSMSSKPLSVNHTEETQFGLDKLELNSITNLRRLNELLQVDDRFSMDSGYMRSSASNKLLLWKNDISKSIELTETEIDLLENKLNLLEEDSCQGILGLGLSKSSPTDFFTCDDIKTTEVIKDCSAAPVVAHQGVCDVKEFNIGVCDIILASNKETASKASGVLTNLLPRVKNSNIVDSMNAFRLSCLPPDARIKKKFSRRQRLLRFKERVISLKYRALYYLWKEDLRLLSLRHGTKPQKKLDATSRTMHNGIQKHRQPIRSRFALPARRPSLVLSTEILNCIGKLLSDSKVKIYRSSLQIPAMILDEKEKVSSRFVSTNGIVEDPCAVEKERALFNPWTIKETEIFMEKLATFGKDFRKIASFLRHKTIADCIEFYYKNQKSESFEKTKKLVVEKQAKPLSSDICMLKSEKKWGRALNSKFKPRGSRHVADDPTDGDHERKPEKVGSSARRPLTPKNVVDDGGTCSEESCGEVDPVDWTNNERFLFLRAFSSFGKDFVTISRLVRTKTRDQCKGFYSKARKCLDHDTLHQESCLSGLFESNDTHGSGSIVEDGCVVETVSIGSSADSDFRTDEYLPHTSQDSTSDGICCQLDCEDTDMEPEVVCPKGNLSDFSDLGHGEVVDVASTDGITVLSTQDNSESFSEATCESSEPLVCLKSVPVAEMNDDITLKSESKSKARLHPRAFYQEMQSFCV
ncbi:hypothetical protein RND81_10G180500 [Saponaria officinalis]|uniref:SANT domain-containing protein n=1 Tax=Saponaria officinalis TaxID=3572 RepID=A0AAW1I646_SAPOF